MKLSTSLATKLFLALLGVGMSAPQTAKAEGFFLPSGPGCEHILVMPGPGGKEIAVTGRVEHRGGFRRGKQENLGFAFIGMELGRPVMLGTQNPLEFPRVQDIGPHPWQAIDWHMQNTDRGEEPIIAAAPTRSRFNCHSVTPAPRVEFFRWTKSSGSLPKLESCPSGATDLLPFGAGKNFNALSLASNGDVYATIIGFNPREKIGGIQTRHCSVAGLGNVEKNAVYLWKAAEKRWYLVVSNLPTANGLFLSPDGTRLCVNAFALRTVIVFQRDLRTGGLTLIDRIFLGNGNCPDNLSALEGSRATAMTGSGFGSAFALVSAGIFGTHILPRPSASIYEIDAAHPDRPPILRAKVSAMTGTFSDATKFGSWWLCGQSVGNGIYCVPVTN